jgi:hypothetical protein
MPVTRCTPENAAAVPHCCHPPGGAGGSGAGGGLGGGVGTLPARAQVMTVLPTFSQKKGGWQYTDAAVQLQVNAVVRFTAPTGGQLPVGRGE